METNSSPVRGNYYLTWFLRGLLLMVALFFLLFSLDSFDGKHPVGQEIVAFLIHNVFTLVLILILIVGWRRQNRAGLSLIGIGVFMIFFFMSPSFFREGTWLIVSLPMIIGLLFLVNHYLVGRGVK